MNAFSNDRLVENSKDDQLLDFGSIAISQDDLNPSINLDGQIEVSKSITTSNF